MTHNISCFVRCVMKQNILLVNLIGMLYENYSKISKLRFYILIFCSQLSPKKNILFIIESKNDFEIKRNGCKFDVNLFFFFIFLVFHPLNMKNTNLVAEMSPKLAIYYLLNNRGRMDRHCIAYAKYIYT